MDKFVGKRSRKFPAQIWIDDRFFRR